MTKSECRNPKEIRSQLPKGPALACGQSAQGDLVLAGARDLTPTFKQHCHLGKAGIGSRASSQEESRGNDEIRMPKSERNPKPVAQRTSARLRPKRARRSGPGGCARFDTNVQTALSFR